MNALKGKAVTAAEKPHRSGVTLLKPHTHEGVDFPTGAKLDVDAATAQWLQDNQVIEPAAAAE